MGKMYKQLPFQRQEIYSQSDTKIQILSDSLALHLFHSSKEQPIHPLILLIGLSVLTLPMTGPDYLHVEIETTQVSYQPLVLPHRPEFLLDFCLLAQVLPLKIANTAHPIKLESL